jgi:hypothetical protein
MALAAHGDLRSSRQPTVGLGDGIGAAAVLKAIFESKDGAREKPIADATGSNRNSKYPRGSFGPRHWQKSATERWIGGRRWGRRRCTRRSSKARMEPGNTLIADTGFQSKQQVSKSLFRPTPAAQVDNRVLDWGMALETSAELTAIFESKDGARENADC